MLINSVALVNFKSYARAVINFQPGMNAIIGANGAGKSSILEAIGFALFNCRGTGYERRLHEGSKYGHVLVNFLSSFDERVYEVERAFSQTTTTRYRVLDPEINQIIVEGVEDVQTWLAKHFRAEPGADLASLFENTIGVPQGTFTAPFLLTAAQRKGVFDPLLQVEEYQRAAEKLLATSRLLNKQATDLQTASARLEGQLGELPDRQSEAVDLQRELAEVASIIAATEVTQSKLDNRIKALDTQEEAIRTLVASCHAVQLAYTTIQQKLDGAETMVAEAQRARRICAETEADHNAFMQAEAQYRTQTRQRIERDTLLIKLNSNKAEAAKLSARQQLLNETLKDILTAVAQMRRLEPNVTKQDALESQITTLEHDCEELEFVRRQVKTAEAELSAAIAQVKQISTQLTLASELEAALSDFKAKNELARQAMRQVVEDQAQIKAEVDRLRSHMLILRDKSTANCPVCETELTPSHRSDLMQKNEIELNGYAKKQADLVKRLQALNQTQRDCEAQMSQLQGKLRKLPSEADDEQAQAQTSARHKSLLTLQEQAGALAHAPADLSEFRTQLTALANPRHDYQVLQERVKREPALRSELAQLGTQEAELASAAAQVTAALEAYQDLDAHMEDNQRAIDALRPNHLLYVGNNKNAVEYEPRRQRVEALSAEASTAQRELQKKEAALAQAKADYQIEEHQHLRIELMAAQNTLAAARTQVKLKRERQETVSRLLADLFRGQQELALKQDELQKTNLSIEMLELIRTWLREAGPQITRRLVNRISQEASNIYCDIMEDHTGWLHWASDYELELEIHGARRAFRQLSGGEQMIAALALRLALLRHTSAIDIAFFDEPTAHLDLDRRDNLAEKLNQIKGFSQVFVISHDDTFERSASSYTRIIKREDGSCCEDKI